MKITLVGLGVGQNSLSERAYNAIKSGASVICKTQLTESANLFKERNIEVRYLDDIYRSSRNFDTLSKKLASAVLNESKQNEVVYCVDGSVADDNSCAIILKRRKNVEVIEGVSHTLNILSRLDSRGGYTAMSAYAPENFNSSVLRPFVLYDIDSYFTCAEWKLRLTDAFGDDAPAILYINGKAEKISLYQMDMYSGYDYRTVLVVLKEHFTQKRRFCVDDLFDIIVALRSENGCPWDREQTRHTIKKNLLEEAYELYDAIERGDVADITEEMGDVLLQIVFHAIFGEEAHEYNRTDVISEICNKMITRHSHVFGNDSAKNDKEALSVWEKNKAKEKGFERTSEYIESVPKAFPALMCAEKVQKRASKSNFDFSSVEQVFAKLEEEKQELILAAENNGNVFEEIGDLLFTLVNLARFYSVSADDALNASTQKFINRFKRLEEAVIKSGKDMKNMTEEELDKVYNEIKKC